MDDTTAATPEPASGRPGPPRRPSTEAILTVVSGALAGVGGVFVATRSVLVTLIATAAALILSVMLTVRR